MSRSGADLALLLLGGYRLLIETTRSELAEHGHPDFRPGHEFALRAIAAGADSASDLGRRMAVTKQAAAKTIQILIDRGYVDRSPDVADARRKRLTVTNRGWDAMHQGEAILARLHAEWEQRIGAQNLATLESQLSELVGDAAIHVDAPGSVDTGVGD